MNRRAFTAALGVLATGALGGCVSNDGTGPGGSDTETPQSTPEDGETSTDTPAPAPTPTPAQNGTATPTEQPSGSGGTGSKQEGETQSPVAVARAFFDSIKDGETKQVHSYIHDEGKLPKPSAEKIEQTQLPEKLSFELVERTGDRARVRVTPTASSGNAGSNQPELIELRKTAEGWKIWAVQPRGDGKNTPTPAVSFEFEYESEKGTVTIVHESGESVQADALFVRGDGLERTGSWQSLSGQQSDGNVEAGDRITVPVDDQGELRVVWKNPESDAAATLGTFTFGSASESTGPQQAVEAYLDAVGNFDGDIVDRTGNETVTVTVGAPGNGGNFAFAPPAIRVDPGTTVVWSWTGNGGAHSVTAEDGSFESEVTATADHEFTHRFEESGVHRYYCLPHRTLGMKGVVVVAQ